MPIWPIKRSGGTEINFDGPLVPIVTDGAMATHSVGEGTIIPVLILDTSSFPSLDELIRLHEYFPSGDLESVWGRRRDSDKKVYLCITFKRPTELKFYVEFDTATQCAIADTIMRTKVVYLQAGRPGDRLSVDINRPKLIAEVAESGFGKAWDEIFLKYTTKKFREDGLGRQEAKRVAKQHITRWREFGSLRI